MGTSFKGGAGGKKKKKEGEKEVSLDVRKKDSAILAKVCKKKEKEASQQQKKRGGDTGKWMRRGKKKKGNHKVWEGGRKTWSCFCPSMVKKGGKKRGERGKTNNKKKTINPRHQREGKEGHCKGKKKERGEGQPYAIPQITKTTGDEQRKGKERRRNGSSFSRDRGGEGKKPGGKQTMKSL